MVIVHELDESHLKRDLGILINDKLKWRYQVIQVNSNAMA